MSLVSCQITPVLITKTMSLSWNITFSSIDSFNAKLGLLHLWLAMNRWASVGGFTYWLKAGSKMFGVRHVVDPQLADPNLCSREVPVWLKWRHPEIIGTLAVGGNVWWKVGLKRRFKSSGKGSFWSLLLNLRENFCRVLYQCIKDPVSQLHLDIELIFIVVHPLRLFLVKLLDLKTHNTYYQKIKDFWNWKIYNESLLKLLFNALTRIWSTRSRFFLPNFSIFCQSVFWL